MPSSQDMLRKRFHEVQVIKETILTRLAPKQAEFDALGEQVGVLQKQMEMIHEKELKEGKALIYELDNEAGMIAKALRTDEFRSMVGKREDFLTESEVNEIQSQHDL